VSRAAAAIGEIGTLAQERIKAASLAAMPNETGGLLLGYFTETGIVVEDAIEVVDPSATPSRYTRRGNSAQKALDEATKGAPSHMGYVGDWHSHPAPVDASNLDLRTAVRDAEEMGTPLALIVASVDAHEVTLSSHVPAQNRFLSRGARPFQPKEGATVTSGGRKEAKEAVKGWWQIRAISIYLIVVGLLLILLMREAIDEGSAAAAASLAVLGGGALVLAAFAPYVEGKLKLGTLEMNLRSRLIGAVSRATRDELRAIVTILEDDDISVQEVELPARYAGHKLTDEPLLPMRKEFQLNAIAIKPPGDTKWTSGGRISEEPLQIGTQLLVAGPPDSIRRFFSE
jgi:proteasome lid subunit RPN8/RPN11